MKKALLTVEGLTLQFGGVFALDRVNFGVAHGEIVGIVGPNGAGKTSLLNCVSGLYRASAGRIWLEDEELTRRSPHEIVRRGLVRTFQHVELVPNMTVEENLMAARHQRMRLPLIWSAIYYGPAAREEADHRRKVEEVLAWLGLPHVHRRLAGSLTLAQQKLVAIGRALVTEPRVLMLDEPASGLSSEEKEALILILLQITSVLGVSEVIVEHDVALVSKVCSRVVVMNFGQKLAEGAPREVLSMPEVVTAYLGSDSSVSRS